MSKERVKDREERGWRKRKEENYIIVSSGTCFVNYNVEQLFVPSQAPGAYAFFAAGLH